ncbi:MAG: hypothetical protein V3S51_02060 [Dehalococcoidia bacterium]
MNKAEIRATAEFYEPYLNRADVVDDIEAALTAAQDASDKQGYERGWDEGVEAAANLKRPGLTGGIWRDLHNYREAIRRLKKGK